MRGRNSQKGKGIGGLKSDSRGGIAIALAIFLPILIATLGMAADYAYMVLIRTNLQKAADAAAIAGAREIPLSKNSITRVKSAALSYAAYALTGDSAQDDAQLASLDYHVQAELVGTFAGVKVDIR